MKLAWIYAAIGIVLIASVAAVAFYGEELGLQEGSAASPSITEEEAASIAENYTGGTATGVEFEDDEDEGPIYEVHIVNATGKWEVEVNADDGSVQEIEKDDEGEEDDDDDGGDDWWGWLPW